MVERPLALSHLPLLYSCVMLNYESTVVNRLQRYLPPLLILLLALGLRLHQLEAQSFWNDEGNSARLSERTVALIIEGTASDIHPPFYYLLLRGWRELAGEHEFGLRSLSVFVGVLTVALTMALGRMIGDERVAWVAGGLTAVSPPLIYYSQETRMYALLACLFLLATVLFWQWLRTGEARLAYVATLTAGLYTHYFFPVVFVVQGLLVLKQRNWAQLKTWGLMVMVALLAYAPWIPIMVRQAGGRGGERPSIFLFLQDAFSWLLMGETGQVVQGWVLAILFLLVAFWLAFKRQWLVWLSLFLPILLLLVAGASQPQFFKFLLLAVPFFGLAVAFFMQTKQIAHVGAWLVVLVVVGFNGRSLLNLYTNPEYQRADYRWMAQQIESDNHPNAGVILNAPNQWEVFTYYHDETIMPVYPMPRGRPVAESIHAELETITAQHDRLYVLFWGEAQRDPERLVERWLDEHAFKAQDEWVDDVRFVTYAVPQALPETMEAQTDLQFGEMISLNGVTYRPQTTLQAGDILQVRLFWQASGPITTRYKVFLHLVDAAGNLVAQRDSEPVGNLKPTTVWQPNELIIDNHGLLVPSGLPAGHYTLLVGLYDLENPAERLFVQTEGGEQTAVSLLTIEITP